MLALEYDSWKAVCKMYFGQGKNLNNKYLQWYPFSKLSNSDIQDIMSAPFFHKYIESGAIVLFPLLWLRTDNYLQKGDGSLRESCLVSPMLYLILQTIGYEISKVYGTRENKEVIVYYAGNFPKKRCSYKKDYDAFYKEVNWAKGSYSYFLKTDIRDFYKSINLDKLFSRIDSVANVSSVQIKQHVQYLYKELLAYCGNGRFPLVENSVASSYLATVVYLDEADDRIFNFIKDKIPGISNFQMMRYVDDLYILFNLSSEIEQVCDIANKIIREYSSILRDYNLALNTSKTIWKSSENIDEELKKSLYEESYTGKKCDIPLLASESLIRYLKEIDARIDCGDLTNESYNQIVDCTFRIDKVEYTPTEVLNFFAFDNPEFDTA